MLTLLNKHCSNKSFRSSDLFLTFSTEVKCYNFRCTFSRRRIATFAASTASLRVTKVASRSSVFGTKYHMEAHIHQYEHKEYSNKQSDDNPVD